MSFINSGVEKSHLSYFQKCSQVKQLLHSRISIHFFVLVHQHVMNIYFLIDINITNATIT